eukprot:scaffold14471_cov104-Skeletonema_marinoi.AAC.4
MRERSRQHPDCAFSGGTWHGAPLETFQRFLLLHREWGLESELDVAWLLSAVSCHLVSSFLQEDSIDQHSFNTVS